MGVQGLWELLAPVGRRVSVETLAGKRLAIDASIWMVQFIKAMRDEKGDMVHNAHLIGFFRRICKLLFLRTKPVFVFDGGTPALKRRTVIARRRQRENAQTKIRKTAEKLLLNRLRDMRLKEQAKDLKSQRLKQNIIDREKKEEKLDDRLPASKVGENGVDDAVKCSTNRNPKGKGILLDGDDLDGKNKRNLEPHSSVQMKDHQEKLDEMLAASLVAEEDRNFTGIASTSAVTIPSEEEGTEEDEEILLPVMDGNVDPAVLASLPPSMQLDLLVQMREKLMAENRQKYQKVKKAPEKFSELQIEAYLKTVAFRREINDVQRNAGGRAVGGVQTSRIASEANREFIFSSNFSGDKEVLASAREGRHEENHKNMSKQSLPVPVKNASSLNKPETIELDRNEPRNPDEKVPFRLRNKHMGIQMTCDIQRNLDLMKEKEKTSFGSMSNYDETYSVWESFPSENQFLENLHVEKGDDVNLDNQNDDSILQNPSSLEISFEHDGGRKDLSDEDGIFFQLAAGGPVTISSTENGPEEDSSPQASDSDWEEMPVDNNKSNLEVNSRIEEISCENAGNSMVIDTKAKFSKKYLEEEEADLQEAIKLSILDLRDKKSEDILLEERQTVGVNLVAEKPTPDGIPILKTSGDIHERSNTSEEFNADGGRLILKQFGAHPAYHLDNVRSGMHNDMPQVESIISPEKAFNVASESHVLSPKAEQLNEDGSKSYRGESIRVSAMPMSDEEKIGFLDEGSICGNVKKGNAGGELSITKVDKRDYSTHKSQSPVTKSQDPSHDVTGSLIGILLETDSKKEIREESNSNKRTFNRENSTYVVEKSVPVGYPEANLEEEMEFNDQEFISLGDEQRKLERNAESVSSEMFAECQELLHMFGLPYIIAPMEAEAQCAFMEQANLVDGIVTDDSDVFLFGARSVYKNIFDDRKYVETYLMKDIEKELGLSREKIICMAMLLGSDYTEGISGIGIVNAIEVVTAFPEEDGLQKFREWVESPDPTILGKTDAKTGSDGKKHGYRSVDHKRSSSGVSADDSEEIKKIFMDKHRKVSKNWHIPSTFPSEAVTSAYLNPQVDQSTEIFSWAKPDLLILRKLCWEKFGWNRKKTDELLLPVLKEYEKHETQLRMEAFYTFNERFAKIRSKRIKKAVKRIGGALSSEVIDHTLQSGPGYGNKKRPAPHETEETTSDKDSDKTYEKEKNKRNCLKKSSSSRGRGRAQKRGQGRRNLPPELSGGSSNNISDDDDKVVDLQPPRDAKLDYPNKLRRSTRSRNPVNYTGREDDEFLKDGERVGNVFAERAENETKTVDASFNDCTSEDYVGIGGGICTDEAEIGDAHLEDKATGDYRVMGGGFCAGEDETGGEDAEKLKMESEEHQNKAKCRNREDASLEENVDSEIGNSSAGGLSAMPFLKRKKSKVIKN